MPRPDRGARGESCPSGRRPEHENRGVIGNGRLTGGMLSCCTESKRVITLPAPVWRIGCSATKNFACAAAQLSASREKIMRTIITTVGTSLLTNSRDDRPWAGWRFGEKFPEPTGVLPWLTTAPPERASAEIHTWAKLGILTEPNGEKVLLVHSHTPDGQYCAERLKEYARQNKLQAESRQVHELNYTDADTFNRGLGQLVRVLAEEIRSGHTSGEVAIAATGGFKAEIAIANLIGALLGAPVYYIYEQFKQLIKLEPLPISLAPDWLREGSGKALLRKIAGGECLPRSEVAGLLKADGRLEMLLESAEEGGKEIVCGNLLGEIAAQLLEAPGVDWPPSCDTSPEKKIKLQESHHRPHGWEQVVNRLARSAFVRLVYYDKSAGSQKGIRLAKENEADLQVVITGEGPPLGLRVETTAESLEQRRLVFDHLRQQLNL